MSSCSESSQAMRHGCTTLPQKPKPPQWHGSIPIHQWGKNSKCHPLQDRLWPQCFGMWKVWFCLISSITVPSMRHTTATPSPNSGPPFNERDQGSWVKVLCSWTKMQNHTQQGSHKIRFITLDGRDWITRPTAPILPHRTFTCSLHWKPTLRTSLPKQCWGGAGCVTISCIAGHRVLPEWFLQTDCTLRQMSQCRWRLCRKIVQGVSWCYGVFFLAIKFVWKKRRNLLSECPSYNIKQKKNSKINYKRKTKF